VEIDYHLAAAPTGDLRLEILDASGNLVRGFTSAAGGFEMEVMIEGMRGPEVMRVAGPRLAADAGSHRFTWDMTAPGPWTPQGLAARGPMVVPGEYQVRLIAGGWSETRRFRLLPDPRVEADGVTAEVLQEQFELSMRVRDVLSEARRTTERLTTARRDLESAQAAGQPERIAAVQRELEEIERVLLDEPGVTYAQPMLVAQLQYLYSMLNRADQKPGRDAYLRLEQLERELRTQVERLERVLARTIS
jgi:hypothetical protein